ncbi:unnamed protein product [Pleuronectes platessa]|uniref:R3H domain-containing protein n=1 Tax=Pleuronectes platessa TaxID=8262 RepID=A0A9N7Y134_PLEPL|nr:unnamed protein product [Pleuronectes platessa]
MADLLGSILSSMEKPPTVGDKESRRKARGHRQLPVLEHSKQTAPVMCRGRAVCVYPPSCNLNLALFNLVHCGGFKTWSTCEPLQPPPGCNPEGEVAPQQRLCSALHTPTSSDPLCVPIPIKQAARLKKMEEHEKRRKAEFRKKDTIQQKRKYNPMGKLERSILHDVSEVAGLASFSFGEDEESRYVMLFKKEFAPSDEELDAYRKGEEWDPKLAEQRRKLKEQDALEVAASCETKKTEVPNSNYRDKYSHLIGTSAAKDAAHTLEANSTYGCVPVANKRDTRSIEEALNAIRAKKRQKLEDDTGEHSSTS